MGVGVGVSGCVVRSLEGLVAAVGLAAVEVAVNAGIKLVHHVRLVRADSVGGRAGTVSSAGLVEVFVAVCGTSETTSVSRSAMGGCGASEGTGAGVGAGVSTGVSSAVSSHVSAVVHVGVDTGIRSIGHSAAVRADRSLGETRGVSGGVLRAHVVAAESAGLVSTHVAAAEGTGLVSTHVAAT